MPPSIEQFTRALISCKGGLAEPDRDGLAVVLDGGLSRALGVPEYLRLAFEPERAAADALLVDYDAPVLERMGRVVDEMGRLAVAAPVGVDLKPIDPEAELSRCLTVTNGVVRLRDCVVTLASYVCFVLEYEVLADERGGGLTEVWVNPGTRSVAAMPSLVDRVELADGICPPDLGATVTAAWRLAVPAATDALRSHLREFIESLARRRERDLRRVREYYLDADREIRRKLARLPRSGDEARRRETMRLEATARSYQARVADVVDRHRMRVRVSPVAGLVCTLPTYRITARLWRRTASADVAFSWNPIDRRVETRCCDACNRPTRAAALCDERVHYLCARCLGPCAHCGKAFCRACHRGCPKHGRQATVDGR